MAEAVVYATALARKVRVELYVNDFPIDLMGGGNPPNCSDAVAPYLVDGNNTLMVVIGPGLSPSTAKSSPDPEVAQATERMTLIATLGRYQEGMFVEPGGGDTLAEIRWSGESGEDFPLVLTATVELHEGYGTWKWQEAEVLSLDDETRESAIKFIEKIKSDYEKGKPEAIAKLAKFKNLEMEKAFPDYYEGAMEEMFKEQIKTFSARPDWKPSDVTPADYDIRLVAGGRLIQAITKDWRPIVQMKDGQFGFHMMIGRIEGEWYILR